jgi:hypothetical protein
MSVEEKWKAILEYQHSSLPGFLWAKQKKDFVDYASVLEQIGGLNQTGRKRYRQFILKGINNKIENPLAHGKGTGIIGEKSFVEYVKANFTKKSPVREQPELRALRNNADPNAIVTAFSNLINIPKEELCRKGKNSIERSMLMEVIYRLCAISQKDIGLLVGGIDYSAVSQARKRLKLRMNKDPETKKLFDEISNRLSGSTRQI